MKKKAVKVIKKRKETRKKHVFTKTCDICGAKCKGQRGLSIHKARTHGVYTKDSKFSPEARAEKFLVKPLNQQQTTSGFLEEKENGVAQIKY